MHELISNLHVRVEGRMVPKAYDTWVSELGEQVDMERTKVGKGSREEKKPAGGMEKASSYTPTVDGTETVEQLKEILEEVSGVPVREQLISFKGYPLKNDDVLYKLGIEELGVEMSQSLRGEAITKGVPLSDPEDLDEMVDGFFNFSEGDDDEPDCQKFKWRDPDGISSPAVQSMCSSGSSTCSPVCSPIVQDSTSSGCSHRNPLHCGSHTAQQPIPAWFSSLLMGHLPTRILKLGSEHGACAVCQDDYEALDVVVETPCRHIFHSKCLKPWLGVNTTCPQCRFELSDLSFTEPQILKSEGSKVSKVSKVAGAVPEIPQVASKEQAPKDQPPLVLTVDSKETGLAVKKKVSDLFKVPIEPLMLILGDGSKKLEDHSQLGELQESDLDLKVIFRLDNSYKSEEKRAEKRKRVDVDGRTSSKRFK